MHKERKHLFRQTRTYMTEMGRALAGVAACALMGSAAGVVTGMAVEILEPIHPLYSYVVGGMLGIIAGTIVGLKISDGKME